MIETGIRHENGVDFLSVVLLGTMTGARVGQAMALLNRYPEYAEGMAALWDLRWADLSRYTTDDMTIANAHLMSYPGRLNVKSVSVVANSGALLLARLWAVYGAEHVPQQRQAFLDIDDAIRWLVEG